MVQLIEYAGQHELRRGWLLNVKAHGQSIKVECPTCKPDRRWMYFKGRSDRSNMGRMECGRSDVIVLNYAEGEVAGWRET